MSVNISNRDIVLKLNANWEIVGHCTVAKAIVDMVGGESAKAIDFQYPMNDDDNPDFSAIPEMYPTNWDDWINLPVRSWDDCIHSTKLTVRVPTVIIANNYKKMPTRNWKGKPTNSAIYFRDGGICQYTGKKIDRKNATKDHIIPKSRGGSDDWTNVVLASKELNTKKGNRLNHEVGLKLIKQPTAPKPIPFCALIREAKHRDWSHFIIKN